MNKKRKSWLRPTGKWTDMVVIALILSLALIYGGEILFVVINRFVHFVPILRLVTDSDATIQFILMYFTFIGIWILFLLMAGIPRYNRPILKTLGPDPHRSNIKGALAGLAIGFGINATCIIISTLMGDIHLYFNEFNPVIFFIFLVVVMIQSGAEEIAMRSYLYQKLRRRYKNPWVAIVVNSVMFAALHGFNPGMGPLPMIQIILIAILFSLFIYYYDGLWIAIMAHTGWNFCQSIFFGLPNSGIVSDYSLFKLDAASATDGFFYTVNFGVEGSIGAVLFVGIATVIIYGINRSKPERHDLWREMELEMIEAEKASVEPAMAEVDSVIVVEPEEAELEMVEVEKAEAEMASVEPEMIEEEKAEDRDV